MTAECFSYNKQTGTVPNVVARNPFTGFDVSLDACIAEEVQGLWKAGIRTVGSCCGHGRMMKTILVADSVD